MDASPLLALPIAAALALLGLVAWAVRGRRPPPPPPVVADAIADAHVRRVERVETEARAVVAEARKADALPDKERNAAIGARLRGGR